MDTYICSVCCALGALSPEEALAAEVLLLAEDDDCNLLCLPCYMRVNNTCAYCSCQGEIFPDTSCKGQPWLCKECLELPYKIHTRACYSNGCMTLEEFAEESSRDINLETEKENSYGGNPWGSSKD
jgi:hypothetical protein